MVDEKSKWSIPKWNSRRGKVFYVRLTLLIIGIILLYIAWSHQDAIIIVEIAATFMGVAMGSLVSDGMLFFIPCKKLKREPYE